MTREGWRRRRVLQTAGSAVVGGTILEGATPVSAQSSEAWPQFGYDGANTGHAPDNTGPTNGVQRDWAFQAEELILQSSPAVVDGTVYVGSQNSNVYALDAANGTEQWTFQTKDSVWTSPAVADGIVYVASADGTVYALNAANGTEQWAFQTEPGISSPAVVDSTVYVSGELDKTVYAFDAANGTEQWTFQTESPVESSPAVVDSTVYIGCDSDDGTGTVYALDAAQGIQQWTFQTEDPVQSSPAVADGTVYVGSGRTVDGTVYALDAADGTQQWTFQTIDPQFSSPAVAEGIVYVGSGGTVYALDAAEGTEQWAFQTEPGISSPAVVDSTVYVGIGGTIYALDAAEGTEQWTFETGDSVSPPAVANGTVYLGSADEVYALTEPSTLGNETSPTVAQTSELGTETRASPATGGGGAEDGNSGIEEYIPLLSVLGVAGAGGVGAWLYRRDDDTGDSRAPTSGTSSPPTRSPSTGSSRRINRQQDTQIPAEIPRAPEVSVEYDALTDREPIGSGGNADVTKATLSTPDGDVTLAIKEPRASGTLHTDTIERMLQEAEIWAKLDDHDHIVGVIDYDSEPVPWIAMEYMDGGHLGERRDEMDLAQKLWTAIAVTKGIRHAHRRGVAHLDLKPENVLLRTVEDGWDVPKVADWGLSKHLLEHSNSIEGLSPQYAAPEQFNDTYGSTDDLTDVYQLGAVFYELFTGRPPFEGRPAQVMRAVVENEPVPPSELANVPEAIDEILLTALAKPKDDRCEDVIFLRNALQDVFDDY